MFWKKRVKDWAKKVDKVVTSLIVWTAVASMIWLSRTKKWKEVTKKMSKWVKSWYTKSKSAFGTCLVKIINFFKKK